MFIIHLLEEQKTESQRVQIVLSGVDHKWLVYAALREPLGRRPSHA